MPPTDPRENHHSSPRKGVTFSYSDGLTEEEVLARSNHRHSVSMAEKADKYMALISIDCRKAAAFAAAFASAAQAASTEAQNKAMEAKSVLPDEHEDDTQLRARIKAKASKRKFKETYALADAAAAMYDVATPLRDKYDDPHWRANADKFLAEIFVSAQLAADYAMKAMISSQSVTHLLV